MQTELTAVRLQKQPRCVSNMHAPNVNLPQRRQQQRQQHPRHRATLCAAHPPRPRSHTLEHDIPFAVTVPRIPDHVRLVHANTTRNRRGRYQMRGSRWYLSGPHELGPGGGVVLSPAPRISPTTSPGTTTLSWVLVTTACYSCLPADATRPPTIRNLDGLLQVDKNTQMGA